MLPPVSLKRGNPSESQNVRNQEVSASRKEKPGGFFTGRLISVPRNLLRERRFSKSAPRLSNGKVKKHPLSKSRFFAITPLLSTIKLQNVLLVEKMFSKKPATPLDRRTENVVFVKKHDDPLDCKSEGRPFRQGVDAKSTSLPSTAKGEHLLFTKMSFKKYPIPRRPN